MTKTNFKTELIAGVTIFTTLLYVLILNSNLLNIMGSTFEAGFISTVLVIFISTLIGGYLTNKPLVLCSYLGETAFCAYILGINYKMPFHSILTCAFFASVMLLFLSIFGLRTKFIDGIPNSFKSFFPILIGVFLMIISLNETGITFLKHNFLHLNLSLFFSLKFFLLFLTFFLILIFNQLKIKSGILIAICTCAFLSYVLKLFNFSFDYNLSGIVDGAMFLSQIPKNIILNIRSFDLKNIIVVFELFMLLFIDTNSIIISIKDVLSLNKKEINKAYIADTISSTIAPFLGTVSSGVYPETLISHNCGGKTYKTSVVVSFLFLSSLLMLPIIKQIPSFIICGVLFFIGFYLILLNYKNIDFNNKIAVFVNSISLIVTVLTLNLSVSISLSFLFYYLLNIFSKKKQNIYFKILSLLSLLFLIAFIHYTFFII